MPTTLNVGSKGESVKPWGRWAIGVASGILVPILLLIVIEQGLRVFNIGFPTDLTVPCTMQGKPAACYNLFFPAPFFPPGMIKTPQVYAVPAAKPKQTFRIFVLGESAAMGDPDPAYGFSRYLGSDASQAIPIHELRSRKYRERGD